MKKTRAQKGITLIALIITIVVLLILAAVAISSIQNDGILHYAQNAADNWNKAQANEQAMLGDYLNYIANMGSSTSTGWTQSGTTVTDGTTTLTVGDYVNYVSGVEGYTDTNGWRVLGAENGQILLLSTNYVASEYELCGADDYLNGISKLDGVCAAYGNGQYADSTKTRSINVDDINRVTGYNPRNTGVYDPAQTGTGTPYGYNASPRYMNEYGNKVTYKMTSDGVINSTGTNGATGTDNGEDEYFCMPDGTELTSDMPEGITVESTEYSYYPNTLTNEDTVASGTTAPGLATDSAAYSMLFSSPTDYYWLGSSFVCACDGYAYFGMRHVMDDIVYSCALCYDDDDGFYDYYGVRAVVSLQSDVKLTSSGSNSWTLSK